jgi:hypothetical protein
MKNNRARYEMKSTARRKVRRDSPAVRAAKTLWDSLSRRSEHLRTVRFGQLLDYFEREELRFSEIADICGVSPARVGQIYKTYFKRLFGDRSGHERYDAYVQRRLDARWQALEAATFAKDELRQVIGRARAASCKVEGIPTQRPKGDSKVRVNSLYINGRRCSVLQATKAKELRDAQCSYFRFKLAGSVLRNVEAVIFHCAAPEFPHRIFIVPRQVLLPLLEGTAAGHSKKVYLPTQKRPVYRNRLPRIDYWKYQNAWHHLRPRKAPSPVRGGPV